MKPRGTPQRIRGGYVANQCAHVRRHRWAPGAVSAFPRPEQPKAAPVPRDHDLGLDNVNGRTPATPRAREPHPQAPVCRREAKTWAPRSMDDSELVSESDDFQVQHGARPDQEAKGVKERDDDGRHDCRLSDNVRKLNCRNRYRVLGRHRWLRVVLGQWRYASYGAAEL